MGLCREKKSILIFLLWLLPFSVWGFTSPPTMGLCYGKIGGLERVSEWWFNAVSATKAMFTARTC